tara:strand:- start:799 stop:1467 length:669 start_codon:yes stop_codon:yes gene_type:complete
MKKCIIIDLDETIGYFSQIYYLIKKFENMNNAKFSKDDYNKIFSTFECIFRPGIFVLLAYLKILKIKYNLKVILYTNSKLSLKWINMLLSYINKRISCIQLFDHVITINNTLRKLLKKNFNDIFHCCKEVSTGYIFMILDNEYHEGLDKYYSSYIKLSTYKTYYKNIDIYRFLMELNQYNILIKISDSEIKNNLIYKIARSEIIKLFSNIKKFVSSNIIDEQ